MNDSEIYTRAYALHVIKLKNMIPNYKRSKALLKLKQIHVPNCYFSKFYLVIIYLFKYVNFAYEMIPYPNKFCY